MDVVAIFAVVVIFLASIVALTREAGREYRPGDEPIGNLLAWAKRVRAKREKRKGRGNE